MGDATRGAVVRFPAVGCRHFIQGRCLYEEHLNPGYHAAWRCIVLARWESVYDEFLDRAENFSLSETELGVLWGRRFERLAEESVPCPDVLPGDGESMPECSRLLEDLCLLRLPECPGQCEHFQLHKHD
jgi:hypothetical protein